MTPEELLERRYRRLLRLLYPREHRREYEEEMVGVLLAGATAGRRAPGLREVLDLAVSALTTRWSRGAHGLREQSWRQATHAVQLFGTILLLAVSVRWVIRTQAALRLPPAVVRRMIVAAVPVLVAWPLVTWPLVRIGVGGPIAHDLRAPEPVLLGALQWSALVLVPLAAMWVAAALNRRLEQSRAGSPSV